MRVRVGILVHNLRKKAGLTQKELAEKMKITQPTLSKLENGDYDGSALDMLWRACMVLHIRLDVSCSEPDSRDKGCSFELVSV